MTETKKIKLRVVFMGTSELSKVILQGLIDSEFNVVGVFTKPDAKIGRKQEKFEPDVKKLAADHKIEVFQPLKFRDEAIKQLQNLKPDLVIVAAYGKIIPKAALETPGFGCLNVHVSLLPKYRGPSPVQNALLQGEKETGVTIMLMDEGVDTGDILKQAAITIEPNDNTDTLMNKLAVLGRDTLLQTIPEWIEQRVKPQSQDDSLATLCQLIDRGDGKIFWEHSAATIHNRYRALSTWPGIFTYWKNDNKLLRLKLVSIDIQKIDPLEKHETGQIFEIGDDIGVQTNSGVIILKEVQLEGKKVTDIKSFVNGYPDFIGSILV